MKALDLTPVREPQKISSYLKREWKTLLLVTLTGLAFDGSMSYAAVLQGRLIDAVASKAALAVVGQKALIFLLVVAVIQTCRALKRYFVRLFANGTGARMRRMLYNSVFSQDVTALSGASAGELMNRAVGDVDICVEGMRKVTTEIFDTGVLMASYLITMFSYDVKTTLLTCMFIPVAMFIAEKLKTIIENATKLARAQNGAVSATTLSNVENALLYRVNSAYERRLAEYEAELTDLEKKNVRADVLENSMQPVYNAIALLGIVAILTRGGGLVIAGTWTIGDFTAFTAIFIALATKASKAAKLFNSYQKAAVSWQRIKPQIQPHTLPDETDRFPDAPAALEVRDLAFAYPGLLRLVPACTASHTLRSHHKNPFGNLDAGEERPVDRFVVPPVEVMVPPHLQVAGLCRIRIMEFGQEFIDRGVGDVDLVKVVILPELLGVA